MLFKKACFTFLRNDCGLYDILSKIDISPDKSLGSLGKGCYGSIIPLESTSMSLSDSQGRFHNKQKVYITYKPLAIKQEMFYNLIDCKVKRNEFYTAKNYWCLNFHFFLIIILENPIVYKFLSKV